MMRPNQQIYARRILRKVQGEEGIRRCRGSCYEKWPQGHSRQVPDLRHWDVQNTRRKSCPRTGAGPSFRASNPNHINYPSHTESDELTRLLCPKN